jgi:hypothetical protein
MKSFNLSKQIFPGNNTLFLHFLLFFVNDKSREAFGIQSQISFLSSKEKLTAKDFGEVFFLSQL